LKLPQPRSLLLRVLLWGAGLAAGLALAVHATFWLLLELDMRPRSFDPDHHEFDARAVQLLKSFLCGSLPGGIRVGRFYEKRNFNDGNELWLLHAEHGGALTQLVAQLKLRPAPPAESLHRIAGVIEDKPDWVVRPRADMQALFVDDDSAVRDGTPDCKSGLFYLWSTDGKAVFLFHITT
jgi:hypothetical protein